MPEVKRPGRNTTPSGNPFNRNVEIKLPRLSGKLVIVVVILLVIGSVLMSSWYTVKESDQAVVLTLGRYTQTVDAGLHFKLPWPLQTVSVLPVNRTQKIELGYVQNPDGSFSSVGDESMMITGDMNIVNIDFFVEWKISDPRVYLFTSEAPEAVLRNIIQASVRSVVGTKNIDDVLTTGKVEIQSDVKEDLQNKLMTHDIGVQILDVKVNDSEPPTAEVAKSFRDVETAKQEKETALNLARQYENSQIPAAQARTDQIVKSAEADKQSKINEATGERDRFMTMYQQFSRFPEISRTRIYLETIEQILPGVKLIIDDGTGTNKLLPLEPLTGQPTPAPSPPAANDVTGGTEQ